MLFTRIRCTKPLRLIESEVKAHIEEDRVGIDLRLSAILFVRSGVVFNHLLDNLSNRPRMNAVGRLVAALAAQARQVRPQARCHECARDFEQAVGCFQHWFTCHARPADLRHGVEQHAAFRLG